MQTTVGVGKMKQFRHVGLVQHDVAGVAERQHGWKKNRPIKNENIFNSCSKNIYEDPAPMRLD